MPPQVTLVGYGLGNIKAFANIFQRLNIPVEIATSPSQVAAAKRLILPGVGAFDWTMTRLGASGLRPALDEQVLGNGIPVLGVCVGLQMMAKGSEEGLLPGLGWIDAEVVHLDPSGMNQAPLPHMGWNDVRPKRDDCLFRNVAVPRYYFLHSYCIVTADPKDVLAESSYGCDFAAAVRKDNIFGTQFHPEKSHQWGIQLLKNFSEL